MTLDALVQQTACWLDGSGFQSTLVVSSRVRLARNLQIVPFTHRASEDERQRVIQAVIASCRKGQTAAGMTFFETGNLPEFHRQLLVERHLISPALKAGAGERGVLVDADETLSVMVNEEDHLRMQVILSGFQAHEAWWAVRRLERELAADLDYAFSGKWGYLTACPTNTGTGLRASILIHLPGLVLTQEIEGVVRGVSKMGFTVRGLYGEGSDVAGNLFQVSNQITLGRSEGELLELLEKAVVQLVECEENARETLLRDARAQIEDKIWRAFGILCHARLLTSQEFMNLSSAVRLGIGLGVMQDIDVRTLNEMMVETQPSHLQYFAKQRLDSQDRDILRAETVRRRLETLGHS